MTPLPLFLLLLFCVVSGHVPRTSVVDGRAELVPPAFDAPSTRDINDGAAARHIENTLQQKLDDQQTTKPREAEPTRTMDESDYKRKHLISLRTQVAEALASASGAAIQPLKRHKRFSQEIVLPDVIAPIRRDNLDVPSLLKSLDTLNAPKKKVDEVTITSAFSVAPSLPPLISFQLNKDDLAVPKVDQKYMKVEYNERFQSISANLVKAVTFLQRFEPAAQALYAQAEKAIGDWKRVKAEVIAAVNKEKLEKTQELQKANDEIALTQTRLAELQQVAAQAKEQYNKYRGQARALISRGPDDSIVALEGETPQSTYHKLLRRANNILKKTKALYQSARANVKQLSNELSEQKLWYEAHYDLLLSWLKKAHTRAVRKLEKYKVIVNEDVAALYKVEDAFTEAKNLAAAYREELWRPEVLFHVAELSSSFEELVNSAKKRSDLKAYKQQLKYLERNNNHLNPVQEVPEEKWEETLNNAELRAPQPNPKAPVVPADPFEAAVEQATEQVKESEGEAGQASEEALNINFEGTDAPTDAPAEE